MLGLILDDGLTLGLLLDDGLTLALGLVLGELELDGLTDALGLTEALGDWDALPVVDSSNAKNSPAVSPVTASVGFDVSPVLVLIRNSPRTSTALALLRERVAVIAVKLVLGVIFVVLLASLPRPLNHNRSRLDSPENALDPKPFAPLTSLVMGFVVPLVRTSVWLAPTVNFQNEQHLSVALPDRLIVMVVPVLTVPLATNRHTLVHTPSAAAPPGEFVYSPSFVQSPVPPDTDVWSFVSPSVVDRLSVTTTRMP